jgi:hypothetical protein
MHHTAKRCSQLFEVLCKGARSIASSTQNSHEPVKARTRPKPRLLEAERHALPRKPPNIADTPQELPLSKLRIVDNAEVQMEVENKMAD